MTSTLLFARRVVLMAEVIEGHIRCHVTAPSVGAKQRDEAADDLIKVARTYLK